jgi:hypothetical protein
MVRGLFEPVNRTHVDKPGLWLPMIRVSLSDSVDPTIAHIIDENVLAIVDTGSTGCCIDQNYVNKHGTFRDTGRRVTTTGATGRMLTAIYNLSLHFQR